MEDLTAGGGKLALRWPPRMYYRRTICESVADGINIFTFEAFDE
jgi:hypothetical protein